MFFFNDTATTEIYTLSLHDALPIWPAVLPLRPVDADDEDGDQRGGLDAGTGDAQQDAQQRAVVQGEQQPWQQDRQSTRLNSSHATISYAVFCLNKNLSLCHSCQRRL